MVLQNGHSVLIIDDDRSLSEAIGRALTNNGFRVAIVANANEGLRELRELEPDLVLLDLTLPDVDGIEVCRQIRRAGEVPVIILTARADETDRVVGLEVGADDYIIKPFSIRELVARVKAVLRRTSGTQRGEAGSVLRAGEIELDVAGMSVTKHGQPVDLTRTELIILQTLMENRGRMVKREALEEAVWGKPASDPHLIEVHMSNLRRKLEDVPRRPDHLLTVRGVGYRMV